MSLPRFAVTPGEPAGIGPDLCLLLAAQAQPYPLIAIASLPLLAARASQLQLAVQLFPVEPGHWPEQPAAAGSLYVWDTPLRAPRGGRPVGPPPTQLMSWKPCTAQVPAASTATSSG